MAVFYSKYNTGTVGICDIAGAFPFLKESGHIVSLVGAGGKSSLLYEMANYSSSIGLNTLVATTTHIFKPNDGTYAENSEQVKQLWSSGSYAVVGTDTCDGKLSVLPEASFQRLLEQAELVLIEADGSKQMPVKVPETHEPVIRPECDTVIGVLGLSALNRPLKEVCFRLEKARDFLQLGADEIFTEVHAAKILLSELGTRKNVEQRDYTVVLNQCDTDEYMRRGRYILKILEQDGIPGIMSKFMERVDYG